MCTGLHVPLYTLHTVHMCFHEQIRMYVHAYLVPCTHLLQMYASLYTCTVHIHPIVLYTYVCVLTAHTYCTAYF